MRRRRAVGVLLLVIGGLVALSLSTVVAGTEKAPARYAQIRLGSHILDVWRDSATRDLTFHWDVDNPSEATRYIPSRLTLAEMSDGQILSQDRYLSSAAAWRAIHGRYGVTRQQVRAALVAGSPSPLPPTAGDKVAKAGNETTTDFGLNIAALAKASGLTLPRLRSLDGLRLTAVAEGRSSGPVEGGDSGVVAVLGYGAPRSGDTDITVNVARYLPGKRGAQGTVDKQMYESSKWPHYRGGGVRYQDDEGQILFPYRGPEWVTITPLTAPSRQKWAAIIHAIVTAPTS